MCITLEQVCDGNVDCIHGDDEMLCNFICPENCKCTGFAMYCKSEMFNGSNVASYPQHTRLLELRNTGNTEVVLAEGVFDLQFLYFLNLANSNIREIQENALIKLINLRVLDISDNLIVELTPSVFSGLQRLVTLNLDGNRYITTIEAFSFVHLQSLQTLRLMGTNIRKIVSNTFAGLTLQRLDLISNNFDEIEEFGLGNLEVEHINFELNIISKFDKGMFTGVSSLQSLRTPGYKYCCIRPNYVHEDDCFPHKDEFSSCDDLMRISALQTMLWFIGLCALLGNISSIIYRLHFDRQRLKLGYGIFVTNLAVADFLMGVYLIIIAVADAVFRKR